MYFLDTTTDYACVHSSEANIRFQLTPFGNWTLNIINPASQVDLTNLKQVSCIHQLDQHFIQIILYFLFR